MYLNSEDSFNILFFKHRKLYDLKELYLVDISVTALADHTPSQSTGLLDRNADKPAAVCVALNNIGEHKYNLSFISISSG